MNENGFTWINIELCLYIANYTLFYKTLTLYTFVKVSGVMRKHQIFFGIDFHVDIGMKNLICLFLSFSLFSS